MNNLIMGFIQPCFIKKNTPEIRKKLEEWDDIIVPLEEILKMDKKFIK